VTATKSKVCERARGARVAGQSAWAGLKVVAGMRALTAVPEPWQRLNLN
jgi:hypothetical protein